MKKSRWKRCGGHLKSTANSRQVMRFPAVSPYETTSSRKMLVITPILIELSYKSGVPLPEPSGYRGDDGEISIDGADLIGFLLRVSTRAAEIDKSSCFKYLSFEAQE